MWRDRRFLDLVGIEHPIVLAPMAGYVGPALTIAVSTAGGLGSVPCATLSPDAARAEISVIRQQTDRPLNVNFFCHMQTPPDLVRDAAWQARMAGYYAEYGIEPAPASPSGQLTPFGEAMCALMEELRPRVVSFHFGLPEARFRQRLKQVGCLIIGCATTVREARWLQAEGVDAIIAQGAEAGGHRGMFMSDDVTTQVGSMALIPQVVDAVTVPVIAAGGIADARGVAAAFMLGASAMQLGTAYLRCPEAKTPAAYRAALAAGADDATALTNIMTGRPARAIVNRVIRELGPMNAAAPAFPGAAAALAPLSANPKAGASGEFSGFWSGQAARLARAIPAEELTLSLARETLARLAG
jgi:nitronate monooxygenase